MSQEDLQKFLETVRQDTSLQEKLKAAGDADAVVAIAKTAGFVIAATELTSFRQEVVSEEELEGVAGGRLSGCAAPCRPDVYSHDTGVCGCVA